MLRDNDARLKKLLRELRAANAGVVVGLPESAAATKHGKSDRSVLDIGTWNEFGTSRGIPPRPFIGGWFDETYVANHAYVGKLLRVVAAGKMPVAAGLRHLGVMFKGQVQQRMADGIGPPNAPSTIAAKGSSTPLIAKGQLRAAVAYWITGR